MQKNLKIEIFKGLNLWSKKEKKICRIMASFFVMNYIVNNFINNWKLT